MSTKVDNIRGTKTIGGKICLDILFTSSVKFHSLKFPRFKVGDIVRIKLLPKSSFLKGYDVKNDQELFEIHIISTNLPIPMYQINSIDTLKTIP